MKNDILILRDLVERAFAQAEAKPDIRRWNSVSLMAGAAAVRAAADDELAHAAQFEGMAEEAKRRSRAMVPSRTECGMSRLRWASSAHAPA